MKFKYRTNIGTLLHSSTYGSVLYIDVNKKLAEDNSNLFWDDSGKMLGIKKNNPSRTLDVDGVIRTTSLIEVVTGQQVFSRRDSRADIYGFAGSSLSYYNGAGVVQGVTVSSPEGCVGINENSPTSRLYVNIGNSTTIGLILKAAASQSANILEIKDSSDNVLLEIQADGELGLIQDNKKIYLGAGRDLSIYYDGTDGHIKTNEVAASDLKITCGSQKTLELQNTVWDDYTVPVSIVRLAGASPADEVAYKSGMILAFDSAVDEYIYFIIQLPHRYKEGTDIKLHIHWTIPTSGSGAGAENVKWDVTYSASSPTTDNSESWPTASTGTATEDVQNVTADTHIFTDIVTMSGTGYKISETIICSLKRDTSVANDYAHDAYLVSVDAHFEVNTHGSRQELIK